MGVKLRVNVCTFGLPKTGLLMKKFKENYLVHLSTNEDVRFLDIEELCKDLDMKCGLDKPVALLNWITYFSSTLPYHIILVVDELIYSHDENPCQWNKG